MFFTLIFLLFLFYAIHFIRLRLIEHLKKGDVDKALYILEMTEQKND